MQVFGSEKKPSVFLQKTSPKSRGIIDPKQGLGDLDRKGAWELSAGRYEGGHINPRRAPYWDVLRGMAVFGRT